jgi:chloride channel protein, CIC family
MEVLAIKSWKPRLKQWIAKEQIHQHEDKLFLVLTLLIGALVGLVVAAFILLTENLGARMYPAGGAAWRRLVIPTLGSLVTGFLLFRYFPAARGSGIPQTKVALFLQDGVIRFRTVLGKFGLSSISLASGIALGREGPSVHVGAGIASVLGRWLGLGPSKVKALIPIGASAALAAAFNTPVAAVLFTLEEVMGDLHAPVLGSIVLSSATSWIVLHLILGDEPLFHVPSYQLVHPLEFLAYALLGVVGGFVSVGFVKLLLWIRKSFLAMPRWTLWFQPVAGGLLVGLLGWFVPDVMGVGYSHVNQALNGQLTIAALVLLVVLKIIATAACYGSGNAGGIFGPSLFIGAMMGGALGSAAHSLFPDYTGSAGAYALVGMGTAFAGIIRTPMTSVIMIFEITRDYSIIVPLMISNLVSYFISQRLQPSPIYESLQHQEGIELPPSASRREDVLLVREAVQSPVEALTAFTPLTDALARMSEDVNALPVVNGNLVLGLVTQAHMQNAVRQGRENETIADILPSQHAHNGYEATGFPYVYPDDPLDKALRRMADNEVNLLPVISRRNIRELVGVVSRRAILETYGSGGKRSQTEESAAKATGAPRGLLIGVIAATLGLMIIIAFLNYHYRAVRQARAQDYYALGNELLREGRAGDAVEQYRNALATSRESDDYRLALGTALVDAGNPTEAEVYLLPLLKAHPEDGRVNLAMGRGAARKGDTKDTEEYYHRAIYGVWPANSMEERLRARFELVDYLGTAGAKTQAVSELLAVPEQAPKNIDALERTGELLLKFGSAQQAAEIFQEILRLDDRNASAYGSLGQAQLAMGDYRGALEAFRNAVKWNPGDETIKKRLEVTADVLALNPAIHGLSARERYLRSALILERAVSGLESCIAANPGSPVVKQAQQLLNTARQRLAQRERRSSAAGSVDENVSLAEQLREMRKLLCGPEGVQDEALNQVLTLLSKQSP